LAGKKDAKLKADPCDRTEKNREKSSGGSGDEPLSKETIEEILMFLKETALLRKAFKKGQGRLMLEALGRIRKEFQKGVQDKEDTQYV
jgi:hypothetical protein